MCQCSLCPDSVTSSPLGFTRPSCISVEYAGTLTLRYNWLEDSNLLKLWMTRRLWDAVLYHHVVFCRGAKKAREGVQNNQHFGQGSQSNFYLRSGF